MKLGVNMRLFDMDVIFFTCYS